MSLLIVSQAEPIPGYRLVERVGGGGFGEVWKAVAPGGLHKAIKIIHGDLRTADPDGARHAEQELRALKRVQAIRHPYLLSLERYDIIEGRLLIVMELADCNLWDHFRECRAKGLPGIPRLELLRFMEEASEVLDLMNNQYQLQHLDIKPQNLFLMHNHVKVADFGLVKDLEGLRAAITGGVTPVYAAPETFEGIATRFCDQYSLAIVFQELLTGVRPFSGANAQQLLVQHLQGLPNLTPLPAADRPVVGRALSKKPEDRFPSCLQFIRALVQAGSDAIGGALPGASAPSSAARTETPGASFSRSGAYPRPAGVAYPPAEPPPSTPRTELRFKRDEKLPSSPAVEAPALVPVRTAPAEIVGEGALLPAVVIGIGQIGIEVVRRFRRQAVERHGSFERLGHLRIIGIDTDPETLQSASSPTASAPLAPGEVLPMRLNRASHYLKPRRNGRSLIEGWFDPQMLYRIPRTTQTLGLRCLGRLAYFDHYRTFATKLREDLEACTAPDALTAANKHTNLGVRTNRPRVYVIAGLGGGTGSGMFIDVAYTARHKLKLLGYAEPEVIGILLIPPTEKNAAKLPTVANTFAALKELNHFSLPESEFSAGHDDRDGQIQDSAPPFTRFQLLPLDVQSPDDAAGVVTAANRAAAHVRRELLSPLGRVADESRADFDENRRTGPVSACVAGHAAFFWPKQAILSRACRWLGETLVTRWLKTDLEALREPVKAWLKDRWNTEELGPEPLMVRLRQKADKAAGRPLGELFAAEAQPFAPKGWFARDPDATKLWQTVLRLLQVVGLPDDHVMQRQVGLLEKTLTEAADDVARDLAPRIARLPRTLLEHPDYRVAGAELATEQLLTTLTQLLEHHEPLAAEATKKSIDAYAVVNAFLTAEEGRRKPSPADVAENLLNFPKWRVESLMLRQICRVYTSVRGQLSDFTRELKFCRQRLDELLARFRQAAPEAAVDRDLMLFPAGCDSVDSAVNALRESIKPDELRALDKLLQKQIEQSYQALFSVCMSSVNMLGNLQGVVEEQTRSFLARRMGESNVGAMFYSRFTDIDASVRAVRHVHDKAAPPVKTGRPPTQEICVMALPDSDLTAVLQRTTRQALPGKSIDFTTSVVDIMVYREWPLLPLTALPQLGPQAEDAYNQIQQSGQGVLHTRIDVGQWADV